MPPFGYKRSRALWDEARRKDAPKMAWVRAILYELQPIRFSRINLRGIGSFCLSILASIRRFFQSIPAGSRAVFGFLSSLSARHWLYIGVTLPYFYSVRYLHQILDAGPIVVIMTALCLIFTIGLGDNRNQGGLSAYSVFNRGYQRLMGEVDVDALVQQHVGGGMAMAGAGGGRGMPPLQEEEEDVRLQRNPRARQQPAAAAQRNDNEADGSDNDDVDDNNDADQEQGQSRKSGKKARRRNLESRREVQRQRQAAMDMGFDGGDQAEAMAMQRILEEQIAVANERQAGTDHEHEE